MTGAVFGLYFHMIKHKSQTGQTPNTTQPNINFQAALIDWFEKAGRTLPWRETDDPYRIWLSEVMLQQTQVKTVLPYYRKFTKTFPTIHDLAKADLQEVLKMWEGLGYYARARNFHRAANIVCGKFGGIVPGPGEELRELPGIGDYIASAISSIVFNHPSAVVDGNVKRVLARLFRIATPVNGSNSHKSFKQAADGLLDKNRPGTFNQAMMELGALVCKPKTPLCETCPVPAFCAARQNRETDCYPKRIRKKTPPKRRIAVGVVYRNGRVLITRRHPEGFLGGLWEFPGGNIIGRQKPENACIRNILEQTGLTVEIDSRIAGVRHAYTHFTAVMEVFQCRYVSGNVTLNGPADYRWIRLSDIPLFPFPKGNHKFFGKLKTS